MTEILSRFETFEECFEFMLAYAAQGLSTDEGGAAGQQVRGVLTCAVSAIDELAERCTFGIENESRMQREALLEFLTILERDARDSLAAMKLVLAQPVISSQLIDNLNASMHLRALLTDMFLIGEVLRSQASDATSASPSPSYCAALRIGSSVALTGIDRGSA